MSASLPRVLRRRISGWVRTPFGHLDPLGRSSPRRRPGPGEAWTEVDGRRVRSFTIGQRTDLPEVVLIPGMGAPAYFYPWMSYLGRWTRATVLDLPGWRCGRRSSSPSTVAGVGVAAARWLDSTGQNGVILVGHSSGAQAAIRTAQLVPDRLLGLVLAGPTLDPPARHWTVLLARVLQTLAHEKPSELRAVLPWYIRSGGPSWIRLACSLIRDRPEDLVAGLGPSMLLFTGDRDRIASPAWTKHLATLSSAEYAVIPGAHNSCFTNPRDAADVVHRAVQAWARDEGAC